MTATISFYTLGCRANQAETDMMREAAEKKGYTVVPHWEKADIKVINSCTVTGLADKKSKNAIKQAVNNKKQKVFVTGCLAVTDKAAVEGIKGIDLIFDNVGKAGFADLLPAPGARVAHGPRPNLCGYGQI